MAMDRCGEEVGRWQWTGVERRSPLHHAAADQCPVRRKRLHAPVRALLSSGQMLLAGQSDVQPTASRRSPPGGRSASAL